MDVKIKNVKGSAKEDDNISWIEAYSKIHTVPTCCPHCKKKRNDLQGAHVYKVGNGTKQYIVPLCPECNNPWNDKEMGVPETYLVPKESVKAKWNEMQKKAWDDLLKRMLGK